MEAIFTPHIGLHIYSYNDILFDTFIFHHAGNPNTHAYKLSLCMHACDS